MYTKPTGLSLFRQFKDVRFMVLALLKGLPFISYTNRAAIGVNNNVYI